MRVEGGQRLVEEEQRRITSQGAGERDPLALPSRELTDACVGEVADPEPLEERRHLRVVPSAEANVSSDIEVREQRVLLEEVADPAALRRNVDAPLRVEQDGVVERDETMLRPQEAGDHPEHGRLARAGRPDERKRLPGLDR